jgi:hypothetical protein
MAKSLLNPPVAMAYCPPKNQKAEMLTASIEIHEQCKGAPDASNLLFQIPAQAMAGGGQGLSETITELYSPIQTAASGQPIGNLKNGWQIEMSVQIQDGAVSEVLDEIITGTQRMPDPSRDGTFIEYRDSTGDVVPTYIVTIKTMGGRVEKYTDVMLNCEVMITARGAKSSGQNYNVTLMMKAMPDEDGLRLTRHFPA